MMIAGRDVGVREAVESWVGIVGGVVAILGAIAGTILWALGHFQSSADAQRTAAWTAKALADQQVLVLRNRINDCDVRHEQPQPMGNLERAACKQYQDEYEQAVRRADDALRAAKEASK